MTPVDIVREGADEMTPLSQHHADQLRLLAWEMEHRDLDAHAAVNLVKRKLRPNWLDGATRECVERLIRTLNNF